MTNGLIRLVVCLAAFLPLGAGASTVHVRGSDFPAASTYTLTDVLGGIDATFTASGGHFQKKSRAGFTGVGVSGKTGGEIDIGESITGVFSSAVYVPYISLAFLFDGPEFGDVQEKASISAVLKTGEMVSYTLTALFQGDYEWTGASEFVDSVSRPTRRNAGVWEIEDPFDGLEITRIVFTALRGTCGRGACTNQSDFSLEGMGLQRLTPIPEPGTMALLLSGAVMLGAVARRRMGAKSV